MWDNPALNPLMPTMQQRIQSAAAPVKSLMQAMKTMQNPQAALQQMLAQNPNYQQAMAMIQKYGNDPGQAFYELAKQNGIDPNEILNALK